eukprot:evm.model.scf_49.12 EVM.evm.TU.scf_49.12   scf_49:125832-127822(-)
MGWSFLAPCAAALECSSRATPCHRPQPSQSGACDDRAAPPLRQWGRRMHRAASEDDDPNAPTIGVTFVERDGKERTVRAKIGENLLELAHRKEIDLEGACEGSLACSTCHVIVEDQSYFDKLEEPEEDEEDMLDLAFGLTDT